MNKTLPISETFKNAMGNTKPAIFTGAEVQKSMAALKRTLSQSKSEGDHTSSQIQSDGGDTKSESDAYLIELGEQLSKAWQNEREVYATKKPDETYEEAFENSSAIVDKIENATATTLEGLKVKVKAYLWSRGELNFDDYKNEDTTDMRLIGSIFTDLQKIGGAA